MSPRALLLAALTASALAAVPGAAQASSSSTTTTTTTTPTTTAPTTTAPTTTPAPTRPPARATARLYLRGSSTLDHASVTVPGHPITVTAVVRPWAPDQRVLVQIVEHGRVIAQHLEMLTPSRRRVYGGVRVTFHATSPGLVSIRLRHSASALESAYAVERHLTALSPAVRPGARGPFVQLLQDRLAALHLYLPRTGVFDQGTELALDAYHRLLGQGEGNTSLTAATVEDLLDGRGAFHVRFPRQGRHAEGDLSTQVLALIDGPRVQELLPISSGKPSTPTVLGSWRIYLRTPGYLPDGMYYSSFFTGGYAIHGYDPAPDYPASHGCMRLPIPDAIPVFRWLAMGDWVDTYYR